jgi:hypothetical protein
MQCDRVIPTYAISGRFVRVPGYSSVMSFMSCVFLSFFSVVTTEVPIGRALYALVLVSL